MIHKRLGRGAGWKAGAVLCLALAVAAPARAEPDAFGLGTGRDGAVTLSGTPAPINVYARLIAATSPGDTWLELDSAAGFGAGDLAMVVQLAGLANPPAVGTQTRYDLSGGSVGAFELARVASVSGARLVLAGRMQTAFPGGGAAQVLRVPEYTDVTVAAAAVVAPPAWDGARGGVLAFLASGTVRLNGRIDASGRGFRGGTRANDDTGAQGCTSATQARPLGAGRGEGLAPIHYAAGTDSGRGNGTTGGGGGVCHNAGGGGGGNGGPGAKGGWAWDGQRDVGGLGGVAVSAGEYVRLTAGGGGGAGQENNSAGSAGGSGGGVVFLRAARVTGNGQILASGAASATASNDGAGGGGAGGTVYLRATGSVDCGLVAANGGGGGSCAGGHGPGSGGGGGRLLVESAGGSCPAAAFAGVGGTAGGAAFGAGPVSGTDPAYLGVVVVPVGGMPFLAAPVLSAPAEGAVLRPADVVFSGTAAAGASVVVYLDGTEAGRTSASAAGAWSLSPAALADGTHTVLARVEARALFSAPSAARTFAVDGIAPPAPVVQSPSEGALVGSALPLLSGTAEAGAAVALSVDGRALGAATAGADGRWSLQIPAGQPLGDGPHELAALARDPAGNAGPSVTVRFRVDATPPETTLDDGPPPLTALAAAVFAFSASEASCTFQCRLDEGPWSGCTTGLQLAGLADGDHRFEARATDAAGNTDATPAARAWRVDATPPDTGIAWGPPAATREATAAFGFTASEPNCVFQCRLDAGSWSGCPADGVFPGLAQTSHRLEVRAVDAAGNPDASPARRDWRVDWTAPRTRIVTGPAALSATRSADFQLAADESPIGFECRLDWGAWAACEASTRLAFVPDGAHRFEAAAVDAAGNRDPAPPWHDWTVDATAPDTSVSSGPAAVTSSRSASFSLAASEAGCTFECRLAPAPFAACGARWSADALTDGAYAFEARARDQAGNLDATPARHGWVVDNAAPRTSIVSAPPSPSGARTASFSFRADDPEATFECRLDAGARAPCPAQATFADLAEGAHRLEVRAVDRAGNAEASPPVHEWTVDLTPPDTAIVSGPPRWSRAPGAEFVVSSSEAGTRECRLDAAAWAPCPERPVLASVPAGDHRFEARARDAAGNVDPSPAAHDWTVDPIPPAAPAFTSPLAGAAIGDVRPLLAGTAEPAATVIAAVDGAAVGTDVADAQGGWRVACARTLVDGTHEASARAIDRAGNEGPVATVAFRIDAAEPDTVIVEGPPPLTNLTTARFVFSSDRTATYECRLDAAADFSLCAERAVFEGLRDGHRTLAVRARTPGGTVDSTPATRAWTVDTAPPDAPLVDLPPRHVGERRPMLGGVAEPGARVHARLDAETLPAVLAGADGRWSVQAPTSLEDGEHEAAARATDPAGNSGPETRAFFVVDTVAPETTLFEAPTGAVASSAARFSFRASEEPASFACRLDGQPFARCASPAAFDGLAAGPHRFEVRAVDAAGNEDPTPAAASWTVDLPDDAFDGRLVGGMGCRAAPASGLAALALLLLRRRRR